MEPAGLFDTFSDEDLLTRYRRRGEVDVAGALFQRYTDLVYGVCLKYLRDREAGKDAVMDIFEHVLTALREHEVKHFKSWLYVTSKNHCLMKLRAAKTRISVEWSDALVENADGAHLMDEPDLDADLVRLEKCIDRLEGKQRECIELFYLRQQSYRLISEQTGFAFGEVKSYVQNGRRNLKICMEQSGKEA